jgi:PAS domain S-box-containing protein
MSITSARKMNIGFGLALFIVAAAGGLSWVSLERLVNTSEARRNAYEALGRWEELLSMLKDAETGQRGYLLTGNDAYLEPFNSARARLDTRMRDLSDLSSPASAPAATIESLQNLIRKKLAELDRTIAFRKTKGLESALEVVRSDEGKETMDELRRLITEIEGDTLEQTQQHHQEAVFQGKLSGGLIILGSLLAISIVGVSSWMVRRDTARRLKAEMALQEQDQSYRLLVETVKDYAIILLDPQGHVASWNAGAQQIKGYRADEILGRHFSCFYPADAVDRGWPEHELVAAKKNGRFEDEGWRVRKDGSRFWANVVITPLHDQKGALRGFAKVTRDVTERRNAQEALTRKTEELSRSEQALKNETMLLSSVIDSMGEGLIVADEHGKFLRWNTAATEILGMGPVALPPSEWSRIYGVYRSDGETPYPPEELPLPRALRGERVVGLEQVIRNSHIAKPIWILCNARPLKDQADKVWGAVVVFNDITERKRAEEVLARLNEELEERVRQRTWQLSEANRELEHKNQENEMFVYSVSHDLRSPLVNLQGFSKELGLVGQSLREILTDPAIPPALRNRAFALVDGDMAESNRFIQSGVMRLSHIIDSLLRLSRAGRVEYRLQEVHVQAMVERIVDSMKNTIGEKQAEMFVEKLPAAWADATALEQLFANLIGNALNYLDPGRKGRIEVGILPSPRDPGAEPMRTYFVRDNGLGIPEAHQNKVFQAFQRLHPTAAPGEGIGLAIVRRIVERHRGRIWVESKVGQGSTFFVSLPEREVDRNGRENSSTMPVDSSFNDRGAQQMISELLPARRSHFGK